MPRFRRNGVVSAGIGSAMPRQPRGTCIPLQTLREPGGRLAGNPRAFPREGRHRRKVVRGSRVVLHRVVVSTYGSIARQDAPGLAWRVPRPLMFLKGLLGEAVECQRGHGAFETRSGHAPRAVGAAPAGEVVAFDPDQSFVHTSTSSILLWDLSSDGEGWNTSGERARKDSCPSPRVISHGISKRPSN